jgi:predicted nicotinamide N-methyase
MLTDPAEYAALRTAGGSLGRPWVGLRWAGGCVVKRVAQQEPDTASRQRKYILQNSS